MRAAMLNRTLDEVRTHETAWAGEVRWPVPWWPPGPRSSYCVGWQTIQLGLRTGNESAAWLDAHPHMISIAAFRAHYQWDEVPAAQIKAGDLVISNWSGAHVDGVLEAEHMEWAYSSAAPHEVVIVGANTGPAPGKPVPNGVFRKARPLDEHIVFGIRVPYKEAHPSLGRRRTVKLVAAYLNDHVPPPLPRTTSVKDGVEGPNYWRLVQTWGRLHGYYGSHFVIDGIPGPQSRIVESAAHKAATTKK